MAATVHPITADAWATAWFRLHWGHHRNKAVQYSSRFNGHDLVDVRVHMLSVDAPTGRPTRKGVALKVGLLPELIAALSTALAEARQRGLMPDQLSAKDRTAAERESDTTACSRVFLRMRATSTVLLPSGARSGILLASIVCSFGQM